MGKTGRERASKFAAQQSRADIKVDQQGRVVSRQNGSGFNHSRSTSF